MNQNQYQQQNQHQNQQQKEHQQSAKQNKNEKLIKNINYGLIDLRNDINRKETPKYENPKKEVDIVEKILDFNKQQKGE